jgi:hypothetical protein
VVRLLVIHHIGKFENSSVLVPPLEIAFCSAALCFASTDQSQLAELASSLSQSTQYPSICLDFLMFIDWTILSLPMAFQVDAPVQNSKRTHHVKQTSHSIPNRNVIKSSMRNTVLNYCI